MSTTTAIATYFLIWWLALFLVLPWGIRSQHEHRGDGYHQGTDPGAPIVHAVAKRLVATTVVASILFGGFYVVYVNRLITLEDIAGWMGLHQSLGI